MHPSGSQEVLMTRLDVLSDLGCEQAEGDFFLLVQSQQPHVVSILPSFRSSNAIGLASGLICHGMFRLCLRDRIPDSCLELLFDEFSQPSGSNSKLNTQKTDCGIGGYFQSNEFQPCNEQNFLYSFFAEFEMKNFAQ
jgi:hypothetical protein